MSVPALSDRNNLIHGMMKYRWLKYCALSKRVYRCKSRSFRLLSSILRGCQAVDGERRARGPRGWWRRDEGHVSATCEELTGDGFSVGGPNSLCRPRRRSTAGSSTSALGAFRCNAFDFSFKGNLYAYIGKKFKNH